MLFPWSNFGSDQWIKFLWVVFLILKFSSTRVFFHFFAHERGYITYPSVLKKVWLFRKDWRINLAFWWYTDILNYPKTGSLAKNHFWFVATQRERSVLIIQMLFSWFSCGSDEWLSVSAKFLCVVFFILKFSSAGLVSVLMRRNGNC